MKRHPARRLVIALAVLLAGAAAALAGGGRPTDQGDEPPTQPPGQDFVCDLNDGRIDVEVLPDGTVRYERDVMYGAFNVYRGEVDVMVSAGIYTQSIASVPGAARWCDGTTGVLMDGYTPPLGRIAFYVGTGTMTGGESKPGRNSAQDERPHHNPCHPCTSRFDCAAGDYCSKAPGNCGGQGVCTLIPEACPAVWDPVCSCNYATFGNACEAAAATFNVRYEGECAGCLDSSDCAAAEYCHKATATCGSHGVCRPRPVFCTHHIALVCGCDGVTYNNECEAWRSGAAVAFTGPCGN